MNIYIINESSVLSDEEIEELHAPLLLYSRHIRSYWGSMQPGILFGKPKVATAWQIVIADDSDQAGALGYHDVTDGGRPISYVFAKTDQDYGYDWQVTLTHEFAEMMMDPYIANCVQTGNSKFHAQELCDPVEDESMMYIVTSGGVKMNASNFVTPYWFIPDAVGQYDHLHQCAKPLEVLDGGYAYYWEDGEWYSEDHLGQKYTVAEFAKKEPTKNRLALYARNRG